MVGNNRQTVVVAGGSLAGHTVVSELDRQGFDGEVVWVGGAEGVAPYSKPALSKEYMQGKVSQNAVLLPPVPTDSIRLRRLDDAVCERLDPAADRVLVDGDWIPFDALFVVTGMRARVPTAFSEVPGVYSLRTLADAEAIRAAIETRPRTVVLGAGLIGCEIAASLRSLGLPVELVAQTHLPLQPLVGKELGRYCLDQHHAHGVTTRLSATVSGLSAEGPNGPVTVALEDGTSLEADLALLGLGAVPNCGWLESGGLDLGDGVLCDEALRSTRANVYAAGDVANWPNPVFGRRMRVEHWSNASAQARHAVGTWLADRAGRPHPAFADVPYFWSDQYGLKYQMVGHARDHDEVRVRSTGAEGRPLVAYYRQGRLVAAAGVNATRAVMGMRAEIRAAWSGG